MWGSSVVYSVVNVPLSLTIYIIHQFQGKSTPKLRESKELVHQICVKTGHSFRDEKPSGHTKSDLSANFENRTKRVGDESDQFCPISTRAFGRRRAFTGRRLGQPDRPARAQPRRRAESRSGENQPGMVRTRESGVIRGVDTNCYAQFVSTPN